MSHPGPCRHHPALNTAIALAVRGIICLVVLSTKELMLSNCDTGENLRVPWTARKSNQSILKEVNPEYSLEGLILKLKLQYFGHLMQRAKSLEKTLMLGKIEGRRRSERPRTRWLVSITDSIDMSLNKLWEIVEDTGAWSMGAPRWCCSPWALDSCWTQRVRHEHQ